MGALKTLLTGSPHPASEAVARTESTAAVVAGSPTAFAVDSADLPGFGFTTVGIDPVSAAPRIDRKRAMQVPAVKRSRDLVAGTLGTLPLELFGPDKRRAPCELFEQPEVNRPRSVTMTDTFEEMLFESVAFWRVTDRHWSDWPRHIEFVRRSRVNIDDDRGVIYIDGKPVEARDVIRFHGPSDGLLIAGARAIRTCLMLEDAAAKMADGVPPVDYFTPDGDVDPFANDEEVQGFLGAWQTARRNRTTGYVPASVKYHRDGMTAEELQLHDSRQHAVIEIARLAGIDSEDLGVSTTSRTYQNGYERRKALIDFTFAPYMVAAQETLSMRHVTPRGYVAAFNPDGLLRADAASRWASYEVGLRVGAITEERIAEIEGVPAENVRAIAPATQPEELERVV